MNRMRLAQRSAAVLLSALVLQATCLPYFHSVARAEGAPSVVVLPVVPRAGTPDGAPERFRSLIEETLSRRDALSIIRFEGQADDSPGAAADSDPSALLDAGQQKLSDLDFPGAADLLGRGIGAMTARPERIHWPRLLEAYVSLAVASFRRGDEESAQKALGSLVRLSPGYQLPDGRFPPIFVREFEKAKKRVERMPQGTITVDGPPGAVAFVNDVNLGMVPVAQENLTAGTHYVKVEGTRGELFGAAVDLRSREAKVTATFGAAGQSPAQAMAAPSGAVGPILDAAAARAALEACRRTGAGFALVGVLYRSGEHQLSAATAVYSAKAQGFIPLPPFAFDHELLTANVEAYRMADAVERTVLGFGRPAAPGHDLAAGATWRPGTAPVAVRTEPSLEPISRRSALTPGTEPHIPAGEGRLRALEGGAIDAELADRGGMRDGEVKSGTKWWVWTLVGVGVVAAAGGTAYGVHQATQPVTGTVTARW